MKRSPSSMHQTHTAARLIHERYFVGKCMCRLVPPTSGAAYHCHLMIRSPPALRQHCHCCHIASTPSLSTSV